MAQSLRQNTLTDQNARPIAGANIYVYDNTGAPAALTSDGVTALSQPVITDSFGNYQYYANTGLYSEDIFLGTHRIFKQTVPIGTGADVSTLAALSASGGSALVGFQQSGTGAGTRSVQAKLQEVVSVKDFGAKGDGVTNDAAAFQSAFNLALNGDVTLNIPPGHYMLGAKITVTSAYSLSIIGAGRRSVILDFTDTGSNGGLEYKSTYAASSSQTRTNFSASGMTLLTRGSGMNAIGVFFPYIASSQYRQFTFSDLDLSVQNVNNTAQKWGNGIYVLNGWYGLVQGCTGNQSINANSGTFINIDGQSTASKVSVNEGQWWANGLNIGWATLKGLRGALTGSFAYGETVRGGTSGATAYVAQTAAAGDNTLTTSFGTGTRYDLAADGISGTFSSGETVTGQTSGATLVLNAAEGVLQIPTEGLYVASNDLAYVSTAFNNLVPNTAIRATVGHNFNGNNTAANIYSFNLQNVYQSFIGMGLYYCNANGAGGALLTNCSDCTITQDAHFEGLSHTTTTGIGLVNTPNCIIDGTVFNCATGVSVDVNSFNNDFGMSFHGCTTNISNGAPVYPATNGNTWLRTVSRGDTITGNNLFAIWQTYTPTVTSSTGTITTVGTSTGRYKLVGKTMFLELDIQITTNGTGAGVVTVTLPGVTLAASATITGRESAVNGKMVYASNIVSANNLAMQNYDSTYPGVNGGRWMLSGTLEIQ